MKTHWSIRFLTIGAIVVLALAPIAVAGPASTESRVPELEITSPRYHDPDAVRQLHERSHDFLWLAGALPSSELNGLLTLLGGAASHGLDPRDYHLDELAKLRNRRVRFWSSGDLARMDSLLTDAVVTYVAHMTGPRVGAEAWHEKWLVDRSPVDAVALVRELRDSPRGIVAGLAELVPDSEEYRKLLRILKSLRDVAAKGGWSVVGTGPMLRPGDDDMRVPALRQRLGASLFIGAGIRYTDEVAAVVRGFQRRCGLSVDGVLGPETVAALDVPAAVRAEQVALNLERLRWRRPATGGPLIRVNAAAGTLAVIERDTVRWRTRVVVGRPDRATPVVSGRIYSLVLNPEWNVPQSLAREDLLPRLQRDPEYAARCGLRVYESWDRGAAAVDPMTVDWTAIEDWQLAYKLQMPTGPFNPMGRVKFVFDNPYSVFLHDTPSRGQFRYRERFRSSGCVRVQKPLELAKVLLKMGGDEEFELAERLDRDVSERVRLGRSVMVELEYLTAWADDSGRACWRDDVYGYDAYLAAVLGGAVDGTVVADASGAR